MTDQSTTDPFNLQRFLDAQAGIGFTPYETALAEMRAGHKQSHWVWYVFPQIHLGTSALSGYFAIKSLQEAGVFLGHDVLRNRYLEITNTVVSHLANGINPTLLMGGTIDVAKLASSLTLFERAAPKFHQAALHQASSEALRHLNDRGIAPCASTIQWIGNSIDLAIHPECPQSHSAKS